MSSGTFPDDRERPGVAQPVLDDLVEPGGEEEGVVPRTDGGGVAEAPRQRGEVLQQVERLGVR
jgi:hypothetical protein